MTGFEPLLSRLVVKCSTALPLCYPCWLVYSLCVRLGVSPIQKHKLEAKKFYNVLRSFVIKCLGPKNDDKNWKYKETFYGVEFKKMKENTK